MKWYSMVSYIKIYTVWIAAIGTETETKNRTGREQEQEQDICRCVNAQMYG
jgi:hypothetical protein